jgi:hypothetical protein
MSSNPSLTKKKKRKISSLFNIPSRIVVNSLSKSKRGRKWQSYRQMFNFDMYISWNCNVTWLWSHTSEFKSQLCHLPAVWPSVRVKCFNFFPCIGGIVTSSRVLIGIQWVSRVVPSSSQGTRSKTPIDAWKSGEYRNLGILCFSHVPCSVASQPQSIFLAHFIPWCLLCIPTVALWGHS